MAPAGLAAMMRNIDIVCAFAWQLLLTRAAPEPTSVAGAALVVACTVGSAFRKLRASRWARAGRQSPVLLSSTTKKEKENTFPRNE